MSFDHRLAFAAASALLLAVLNAGLYASMARMAIRKPAVRPTVDRTGGAPMIGAGLPAGGWGGAA